jgi:dTDP-4-dehydrorhamnose reductase
MTTSLGTEGTTEQRVLLTGAGGMLGGAVYKAALKKYGSCLATDIDLNEPWLSFLDVRDIHQVEKIFEEYKPTIVMHLAALTDLEYCELNPEESWKTNALGTENVALIARKHNATMVYICTAGIFGGEQEEFTDFDKPNPLSHYAKSKYHGERFVEQYLTNYYIFRAGWMMGGGLVKDKKFINKIYKQLRAGKKELFVVDDKLGTPTYTVDFANSIMKVIDSGYYGLYNQVCEGSCSRLDVAKEFIKLLGLEDEVVLTMVPSSYFKQEYFAPRPYSEKLVNLKLRLRQINYMRHWKEALADYAKEFREHYDTYHRGGVVQAEKKPKGFLSNL